MKDRRVVRIGIDSGRYGGVAIEFSDGHTLLLSFGKMFEDSLMKGAFTLAESLRDIRCDDRTEVYMEYVAGYINGARPSPKGMFTWGTTYGVVIGAIASAVPQENFHMLTPPHWMRLVDAGSKKRVGVARWKAHLRELAITRHPELDPKDITLATADALLILDAGKVLELEASGAS